MNKDLNDQKVDFDNTLEKENILLAEIEEELKPVEVNSQQEAIYKSESLKKHLPSKKKNLKLISAKKLQPRKSIWKKRLFSFAVVLVLGVVTGSILGGWYKNYSESLTSVTYPSSAEPYLDNTAFVVGSAIGKPDASESELKTFVSALNSQGKTPLNFTASQNVIMASYRASLASTFKWVGQGEVNVNALGLNIGQSVCSVRAFDGNKYELTSLSSGVQPVAMCVIHEKDSPNVNLIQGENITVDETTNWVSADWTGQNKLYSVDEFKEAAGSLPDVISPYIVSSKTVLNESSIVIEKTTLNDKEVYAFTMELDPILGAIQYNRQVSLTSGLNATPKFTSIKIKNYLDNNWNFVRTEILETYNVKYMGAMASCTGTLNIDYEFDTTVTLPY